MNRDRGSMGGCSHTNESFYGHNGCRQCDEDLQEWLAEQERQRKEYEEWPAEQERQRREREERERIQQQILDES
jgi:hypothetical protein